jgi:hypothetical protein
MAVGPFFPWATSRCGSNDSVASRLSRGIARKTGLWLDLGGTVSDARRRAVVRVARDMSTGSMQLDGLLRGWLLGVNCAFLDCDLKARSVWAKVDAIEGGRRPDLLRSSSGHVQTCPIRVLVGSFAHHPLSPLPHCADE